MVLECGLEKGLADDTSKSEYKSSVKHGLLQHYSNITEGNVIKSKNK